MPDQSWYTNGIVCVAVVSMLLATGAILLIARPPIRLLQLFIVSHFIVFVFNDKTFIVSEAVSPLLLVATFFPGSPRGVSTRTWKILLSLFLLTTLVTSSVALLKGTVGYAPQDFLKGIKFLVWPVLGVYATLRLTKRHIVQGCIGLLKAVALAGSVYNIAVVGVDLEWPSQRATLGRSVRWSECRRIHSHSSRWVQHHRGDPSAFHNCCSYRQKYRTSLQA